MSDVTDRAVDALKEKIGGGFDGVVCFEIEDEGTIVIDQDGVREGTADADVTMTASADTFRQILEGDLSPTAAFMSGRLKVDGDMGAAMRLGSALG